MKGKFKLFGHMGLALFLVSVLVLTLAPVAQAATAVTDVWVEFEYTSSLNKANDSGGTNQYLVHFKPTTALKRGVDTVTVTWPDGSATMCGTTSTALAFSTISSITYSDVDFSTDYGSCAITDATFTDSNYTAVAGGYRTKVVTPIDVAAGQDVWVRFASTSLVSGSTEGSSFKVYVSTSKDTTPVLSGAFALGTSVGVDPTVADGLDVTVSPATAGAAAQYIILFMCASGNSLTADTDTVTVKFPVGTVLPSSISASNVLFSNDASDYTATGTTPVVDQERRTITATVSVSDIDDDTKGYMKILSAAGVTNPPNASTDNYYCMVRTSQDIQWFKAASDHSITAGSSTAVAVCNGEIGQDGNTRYSDNATMINMYSGQIYLALVDDYGNSKAPASAVTVTLGTSSGTGGFFWDDGVTSATTMASCTTASVIVADPGTSGTGVGDQIVYYKDSTPGTHTLTFTASGYNTATWTFTVAPAISLYDSSDNLVDTYGPTTTVNAAETAVSSPSGVSQSKYGVDYINDAITAAMAGDTVKLGDGIYELDTYINLNEAVTLTSVNGASSTTLRPTTEIDRGIVVGTDGTSTNPIIIDGLTFTRLMLATEMDMAVYNDGYDYVTVRNCIFDYVYPDAQADSDTPEGVVVFTINSTSDNITSATISDNTFTNCGGAFTTGAKPGVILVINRKSDTYTISGVTISGNTLTSCNGYGIDIKGYASATTVRADITDNIITDGVSPISIQGYTTNVNILRNTITGGYMYGIRLEDSDHNSLVMKNNTITGCAGCMISKSAALRIDADAGEAGTDPVIQYNDIYDNDAEYSIAVHDTALGAQNCRYNYFGDATGPYYLALIGATVGKSNPDGAGVKISDYVTYYPWLHKSRADVVADNASYQTSNMKLVAGWNTMSTPVKLISTADSVDELIPSGMTIGYYYDGGWQQITTGYVLDACDAVYVKMSAATYVQFKFDAGAFSTPSKDLDAGWNLISLAYLGASKDATDAVASVALTAAGLPGWSQVISPSMNAAQTDIYGATETAWSESAGQDSATDTMQPGLGYWCYMQNAATLAGFELTPIVPDLD